MGPDALQLDSYGGAAAAALLLWAVCVLCRRRRLRARYWRRGFVRRGVVLASSAVPPPGARLVSSGVTRFWVLLLICLVVSLGIMYILGSASYQGFDGGTEDDTSFTR